MTNPQDIETADLIKRLESAAEDDQYATIVECVNYAFGQAWIGQEAWMQASRFLEVGAFLDAAMTLVSEGMLYNQGRLSDERISVSGAKPYHAWVGTQQTVYASTAALALCTAALRAAEKVTP